MFKFYRTYLSRIQPFFYFLSLFVALLMTKESFPYGLPKTDVLKVCSDAGFLPFEMKNNEGQWEGYDIEMMSSFASSIHKKLEMVQINFDGIIPALLSGKCDMVAAGMTVTPSREKVVLFTHPTFKNGLSIAIKNSPEEKLKYTSLTTLDQRGLKIAVKTGYTSDIYLTKILKNAQILRFDQDTDLYLAVLHGRADAFVSDSTYVSIIAKENPSKLIVIPTNIALESFSVAARKQDSILVEQFNQFLDKWKNSLEHTKIYNKYFKN
jgi:polar amino acid transport system substrate-binding protein